MSGNSLGNVPQDKNLSNLNVLSTIGQCNTSLRGKCITTNNLNVNYINGIELINIGDFDFNNWIELETTQKLIFLLELNYKLSKGILIEHNKTNELWKALSDRVVEETGFEFLKFDSPESLKESVTNLYNKAGEEYKAGNMLIQ
mgnify:CR=1 FL=1